MTSGLARHAEALAKYLRNPSSLQKSRAASGKRNHKAKITCGGVGSHHSAGLLAVCRNLSEEVPCVTLRDLGRGRGERRPNVIDGSEPEFDDPVDRYFTIGDGCREIRPNTVNDKILRIPHQIWKFANRIGVKPEPLGCDFIDVSSGALDYRQKIVGEKGYQVPFAEPIRRETGIVTMAVGLITDPQEAESIISEGKSDLICMARGAMWDPRWAWHAAEALGAEAPYAPQVKLCHPSNRPWVFPRWRREKR